MAEKGHQTDPGPLCPRRADQGGLGSPGPKRGTFPLETQPGR